MRGLNRATPIVTLAAALAGVTCAFPTDKSNAVFVTVHVPKMVVLRGEKLQAQAHLWQRTGGGTDSAEIKNVVFEWTSDNDSLATVKDEGFGGAAVTGVVSGSVTVTARAPAFEKAQAAYVTLRVSNPLEVDSVRPKLAHHGQIITVYGVGVDSMFIASLAGVNLIEYPFSRKRDSTGVGQIKFWVPPPARTDSLFYLGAGVFGFDTARTNVVFRDIYEPNDTSPDGPTSLNLDQQGPWPGTILAPIVFTNPALAFEPVERATSGEDWFRFVTLNANQPVTVFIKYPQGDTSGIRIFLSDSLAYDANNQPTKDPIEKFLARDSSDFLGSAFSRCKVDAFSPPMAPQESLTVALKSLPSRALHVLAFFSKPGRYGLTVARGYFTADPQILPDAFEENDMCTYADSGNRRINLSATFSDTLTIDNPHEIDWLRIDVPGPGPTTSVRLRTSPRPFAGAVSDTSDIDLYLLTVPNPGTGARMALVALDTSRGSNNDISVLALPAPGSYYVAVVDFAGAPVRYSLCMARGVALCSLIPSAPVVTSPAALAPAPPAVPSRALRRRSSHGPIVRPIEGRALMP